MSVGRALEIAREMARRGIPIFTALADPGTSTGFRLPLDWEKTVADPAAVDSWRPGMALCAVGGHACDFVDVDPRNGGLDVEAEMRAAGAWPKSYGRASTPSGGTHDLIAPLGIRKGKTRKPGANGKLIDSGVDVQAGAGDGQGRGFVFLAPTVRKSKVTGEMRAYAWQDEPDLEALAEWTGVDDSGDALRAQIMTQEAAVLRNAGASPGWGLPPAPTVAVQAIKGLGAPADGIWTREQAEAHLALMRGNFAAMTGDGHGRMAGALTGLAMRHARFSWGLGLDHGLVRAEIFRLATVNGCVGKHGANAVYAQIDSGLRDGPGKGMFTIATAAPPPFPVGVAGPIGAASSATPETPGAAALARMLTLPEAFWAARPVLAHIRAAAHARNRSGDVALHSVLARLAALHPASETLDTGVGDPASLNHFVAITGPSGAGKSSGLAVAGHLLNVPAGLDFEDGIPLGSGEGLAEAFMGMVEEKEVNELTGKEKTRKIRRQVRANAFVYADEGEALTKLLERAGTTIGEALRRAWVGARLGQKNGTAETTRIVVEYSLGVVIGFQPDTALPLLADSHAGTPQRFLWVWAADPSIPDVPPVAPGPLPWVPRLKAAVPPAVGEIQGLGTVSGTWIDPATGKPGAAWCAAEPMTLDDGVKAEIRAADLRRSRGEYSPPELDAHEPLSRVKVAGLLALLDGRGHVTREDWDLSGVIWAVSCRVRDHLVLLGRDGARRKWERSREQHGELAGVAEAAALSARAAAEAVALQKLVVWVIERVRSRGTQHIGGKGGLRQSVDSKLRGSLDVAIDLACEAGALRHLGDRVESL